MHRVYCGSQNSCFGQTVGLAKATAERWKDIGGIQTDKRDNYDVAGKVGELTRFLLADALSGLKNNIELQYNYTVARTLPREDNVPYPVDDLIFDFNNFSIMADKDTYIQVAVFRNNRDFYFYSCSKVDGLEFMFKDVVTYSGAAGIEDEILAVLDKHFSRFVEGVKDLATVK